MIHLNPVERDSLIATLAVSLLRTLPETLISTRKIRGLTARIAAGQIGCSSSELSDIERGRRKPRMALTEKILLWIAELPDEPPS